MPLRQYSHIPCAPPGGHRRLLPRNEPPAGEDVSPMQQACHHLHFFVCHAGVYAVPQRRLRVPSDAWQYSDTATTLARVPPYAQDRARLRLCAPEQSDYLHAQVSPKRADSPKRSDRCIAQQYPPQLLQGKRGGGAYYALLAMLSSTPFTKRKESSVPKSRAILTASCITTTGGMSF